MRTREVIIFVRRGDQCSPSTARRRTAGTGIASPAASRKASPTPRQPRASCRRRPGSSPRSAPLDRTFTYEGIRVESFVADAPAGWEPTLDWEHDEYRWCTPGAAAELLYWPEPREIVESL